MTTTPPPHIIALADQSIASAKQLVTEHISDINKVIPPDTDIVTGIGSIIQANADMCPHCIQIQYAVALWKLAGR
ncbi:hypothetical protein [Mycobacteroides abscessus]|uniref:hypothetical protein n=1 Tax=Mycobacteroides abscessus TaxID=36809 RepID=UPI000696D6FB|nr:hypothetical protein [Mycobacteroides abscessus]